MTAKGIPVVTVNSLQISLLGGKLVAWGLGRSLRDSMEPAAFRQPEGLNTSGSGSHRSEMTNDATPAGGGYEWGNRKRPKIEPDINRRKFLGSAALSAAAFAIVPRHVLGRGYVPPSDKITVAHVGFGTEAIREVASLLENPSVHLTAVCDVEKDGVNYLEWTPNGGRGNNRRRLDEPNWREGKDWVPGGRDVGKEIIETYYAKKRATDKFSCVNTYIDRKSTRL